MLNEIYFLRYTIRVGQDCEDFFQFFSETIENLTIIFKFKKNKYFSSF